MKVLSIREAIGAGFSLAGRHILFFMLAIMVLGLFNVVGVCVFLGINWPTFMFFVHRLPEVCGFLFADVVPTGQDFHFCLSTMLDMLSAHWILYSSLFIIGFIAIFLITGYMILGWISMLLSVYDYHKGSLRSLFVHPYLVLPFVGASLLYVAMVAAGTVALIIPGIFLAITFGMFGCVIVDKKVGIIDSLRMSAAITHGAKMRLFLLGLVMGIISMALDGLGSFLVMMVAGMGMPIIIVVGAFKTLISIILYLVASITGIYAYRVLNAQTYAPVVQ